MAVDSWDRAAFILIILVATMSAILVSLFFYTIPRPPMTPVPIDVIAGLDVLFWSVGLVGIAFIWWGVD